MIRDIALIAKPYAKALFSYAQEQSKIEAYQQGLSLLARFANHDLLKNFWKNPQITKEEAFKIFAELVHPHLDVSLQQNLIHFIHLLADNHRLALLPVIFDLFNEFYIAEQQLVKAEVIVAHPLKAKQEEDLKLALQRRWKRSVVLSIKLDPSLLGGFIIRANDQVIDASFKTKLQQLTYHLIM